MGGVRPRKTVVETPRPGDRRPGVDDSRENVNGLGDKGVSPKQESQPSENIFLFIPNIIGMSLKLQAICAKDKKSYPAAGYTRIILAIASLYYMPLHPRTCSLLYSVSCLLDALDGLAARYFQQSTRFGAVLDMVTDRCTTACLLVFLSSAWPRWALLFQGLISLDLASHYMHMYATLTMAGSGQSHKKVDQSRSRILHLYYNNKVRGLELNRESKPCQ